jgi:CHAT domain-containing protein
MDAVLLAGKPEEAFNYSERARSRVFLDLLGSRVQLSRVRGGLLEEERALNEQIAGLKARLASEEEEASRESLRSELTRAERAYSIFLSKVRKEDKEQASLMTVEPLGLKQVQELLDPGTTLLEYFVTGKEVFAWVIEREKLQFQRVELPKEKLNGLVKTLRDSIFTLGEREKFNETSAVLYKQLIEPLLPHITGKELIIVPHDVLHYLPFHALVGSDGRYLIEKYPVYYLSSASLLQFVKEKRKASGEKVLAFGNPDLGDPEKNLEFAELEAEEVKNVYPQATVFVKKEASEEKSKSLSPTYDILHFATHAQLDEDDPLSSAVLLAREDKEDGRLEVREIFGMELKANLVVLSGCETGLGKLSTGDELVGLTRAFIYAGTPSVVASLWSVDDSSTAQLMASFYRNLKTMSKVEALRQAQLELIRGEGNTDMLARRGVGGIGKLGETVKSDASQNPMSISTSHPYFWAPFILVGDGK